MTFGQAVEDKLSSESDRDLKADPISGHTEDLDLNTGMDSKCAKKPLMDAIQSLNATLSLLFNFRSSIHKATTQSVFFEHLWFLFKLGTIIIEGPDGLMAHFQQAYRVLHVEGGYISEANAGTSSNPRSMEPLQLRCYMLGYDGESLGPRERTFKIHPFLGTKEINQLDVFPVTFSKWGLLERKLEKRGEKFIQSCYGLGKVKRNRPHSELDEDNDGDDGVYEARGEVFADIGAARKATSSGFEEYFGPWQLPTAERPYALECSYEKYVDKEVERRIFQFHWQNLGLPKVQRLRTRNASDIAYPSPVELTLLPPNLLVFSLQSKKWSTFLLPLVGRISLL